MRRCAWCPLNSALRNRDLYLICCRAWRRGGKRRGGRSGRPAGVFCGNRSGGWRRCGRISGNARIGLCDRRQATRVRGAGPRLRDRHLSTRRLGDIDRQCLWCWRNRRQWCRDRHRRSGSASILFRRQDGVNERGFGARGALNDIPSPLGLAGGLRNARCRVTLWFGRLGERPNRICFAVHAPRYPIAGYHIFTTIPH